MHADGAVRGRAVDLDSPDRTERLLGTECPVMAQKPLRVQVVHDLNNAPVGEMRVSKIRGNPGEVLPVERWRVKPTFRPPPEDSHKLRPLDIEAQQPPFVRTT